MSIKDKGFIFLVQLDLMFSNVIMKGSSCYTLWNIQKAGQ